MATKSKGGRPAGKSRGRGQAVAAKSTAAKRKAEQANVVQVQIVPSEYISNPFGLINPSLRALQLNIWTVLGTLVGGIVLVVGFLAAATGTVLIAAYAHNARAVALSLLVVLALGALAVIFLAPLVTIVLLESAKGNKVRLGQALTRCWHYAGRIFMAGLLTFLATIGGLALLIVPGVIFATWFSLAAYVIVDEDSSAIEGLRRSRELVRGHLAEMFGLYGLGSFLNIVPVIGGLVSLVLALMSLASPGIRYLQLKGLAEAGAERATTSRGEANIKKIPAHWANWAVIILAVISFLVTGYRGLQNSSNVNSPSQTSIPTTY